METRVTILLSAQGPHEAGDYHRCHEPRGVGDFNLTHFSRTGMLTLEIPKMLKAFCDSYKSDSFILV